MVDLISQNLEPGKTFRAVLMTVQRSKQHLIMFRHQLVRVFHLRGGLKGNFFLATRHCFSEFSLPTI